MHGRCVRDCATPWETTTSRPWILIFSCLQDKPVAELAQILFPLFKQVIFAPIHSLRATPVEDLLAAAAAAGTSAIAAQSVIEAIELARLAVAARKGEPPQGLVVVSGSVYLVGEARGLLMSNERHNRAGHRDMSPRPNPLPRLHRWRSNIFQAPFFFLATGFFGTLALLASLVAKTGRTQHRIARVWARVCVALSGSRLTIQGAENLKKHPVAVYAANHTSYMDTPVVFSALPFQFRILAKKELWSLPFIGWYLNRSGQIPINTENPRATLSSLGGGVKALRSGMPLFVFPEGSRTPDGELQVFLAGAAFLGDPGAGSAGSGGAERSLRSSANSYPAFLSRRTGANGRGRPSTRQGMTLRQVDELTARLRSAIAEMLGRPLMDSAASTSDSITDR